MEKEMDLKKTIAAPEKKEGGFNEAIQSLLALKLSKLVDGSSRKRSYEEEEEKSPTKRPASNHSLSK